MLLKWAFTFLVLAIIAAVLGFGNVAGAAATIAKIFFFIFLVMLIISIFAVGSLFGGIAKILRGH